MRTAAGSLKAVFGLSDVERFGFAEAEALCEAMSRPSMRLVPVKTAERQAALMLVGLRDRLIRNRTQLANTIRGYAAEFGLAAAKGFAGGDLR